MNSFLEYESRCKEIAQLLSWLEEQTKPQGDSTTSWGFGLSSEIDPTLKASVLLMLYNLVEGTASAAVAAIKDEIEGSVEPLAAFSNELVLLALGNISRADSSEKWHAESVASPGGGDIVRMALSQRRNYFSGNLNLQALVQIFARFGILLNSEDIDSSVDYAFRTVHSKRNLLAHGEVSFSNIGRDLTVRELSTFFESIRTALDLLVAKVGVYIDRRLFVANSS